MLKQTAFVLLSVLGLFAGACRQPSAAASDVAADDTPLAAASSTAALPSQLKIVIRQQNNPSNKATLKLTSSSAIVDVGHSGIYAAFYNVAFDNGKSCSNSPMATVGNKISGELRNCTNGSACNLDGSLQTGSTGAQVYKGTMNCSSSVWNFEQVVQ